MTVALKVREDMLWNLETWADELIDWPTDNSKRGDILYVLFPSLFLRFASFVLPFRHALFMVSSCSVAYSLLPVHRLSQGNLRLGVMVSEFTVLIVVVVF